MVKNPNINNGVAIQIYADMNPAHDGGGWTLLIANGQKNWTFNEVPQINQATPPGSESELLGYTGKYSILLWGDFLKKNPSDFQYRIDADEFWNHGGVWSVKNNYSFMSTSPNNTNIISNFDWYGGYLNTGIEQRMPFLMDCTADITAFLTTTSQGCTTEWWGTLVQGGSWPHGVVPWIAVTQTNEYQNPSRIWYWVR